MNTDKELTPEEKFMLIIKKHIPNGCVNMKSYGEEIGAITKCMIEYGQQQYEKVSQFCGYSVLQLCECVITLQITWEHPFDLEPKEQEIE